VKNTAKQKRYLFALWETQAAAATRIHDSPLPDPPLFRPDEAALLIQVLRRQVMEAMKQLPHPPPARPGRAGGTSGLFLRPSPPSRTFRARLLSLWRKLAGEITSRIMRGPIRPNHRKQYAWMTAPLSKPRL